MKLDDIKKLQQKKYRDQFGHFLVEGEHLVLELQKAAETHQHLRNCQLYVTEQYADWKSTFPLNVISERQMTQLSDTKSPQGIIALAPCIPSASPAEKLQEQRAIYLHEIQDPGNLGTILRSLAWFGDFRCILSPNSVDPFNPKVVRSSMGAIFHVPIELDIGLEQVKNRFSRIACLDMQGSSLTSSAFKGFECYVFGNEARGIPREKLVELGAQPFTIAGAGLIESLNLATAVNICVYELKR